MQETISQGLRDLLPEAASATRQAALVDADAETTFAALRTTDMAESRPVMALARARAIPAAAIGRIRGRPPEPWLKRATLADLIEAGYWVVLRDEPPRELVLGLVMWDERVMRGGMRAEIFADPAPGSVRVGWSFTVEPLSGERSLLVTETRTEPTDPRAAERFRLYWRLISPFAALTRRLALDLIARTASERQADREPRAMLAR